MIEDSVISAFWSQCRQRPDAPALVRKKNAKWEPLSWSQFGARVAQLASAFKRAGLQSGDRVAIFSDNCPEWVIADYACMAAGLVSVPLYPTLTDAQVRYIIEHSGSRFAVVRGLDRLKKLLPITSLEKIIVVDVTPQGEKTIAFGKFIKDESTDPLPHIEAARALNTAALATIVYTSGTTAEPKGVMLSHANAFAQCKMLANRVKRTPKDIVLSYLPLSHITERANTFRQALVGYAVFFAQSFDTMAADLKEVRPTAFVAVPRVWEKFQEALSSRISKESRFRRRMHQLALEAAGQLIELQKTGRTSLYARLKLQAFDEVMGKTLRKTLGLDRCRLFISGAAPLDLHTIRFFYSIGIPLIEAYGMTEACGGCFINHDLSPAFGTVGPALDGLECKLASDGEILLRGGSIFMGYFKDPMQTTSALADGWLHTGDIGVLDGRGNLTITDRKKNIIITSGGKNVAPAPLEARLKRHPLVSQAVVVGDRRKYLTALITLAAGADRELARTAILKHVEEMNAQLPSYEKIKRFTVLDRDFTVEAGELTATLKLRRGFIQERYKTLIDQMYESKDASTAPVAAFEGGRLLA
ncbi:MAG TPA: long-chain fatty acid--CoA ligase [Bdellovibrionales bacterium]|nr:long-chain fatty acid--CoA ligase [Bdellovibrionales bacterium]